MCGNKKELILVRPVGEEPQAEVRLSAVLDFALSGIPHRQISDVSEFQKGLTGKKILFAVAQGESGVNLEYYRFLRAMRLAPGMLEGSVGGVIADGSGELFTKSVARELVFTANGAGCGFPGRPLVEGTGSLHNFAVQARNLGGDVLNVYQESARRLAEQVLGFAFPKKRRPKLLVLHASNAKTSNTYALWGMVKEQLSDMDITEISLRNGSIIDCGGCPYTTCLHFGQQERCYYGGVIVEQVYPAVRDCDGLVMLCPNYNDAVNASLCAFINRLTALFRKMQFYDKYLFSIVVSGYSGGDLVAEQLISALNMNKTFILPPNFAMLETANDPGSIWQSEGIARRAEEFAASMGALMMEEPVGTR